MKPVLLIDFGSTYTKVTAVDLAEAKLLGTAQSYTTVETDVNEGLQNALRELEKTTGPLSFLPTSGCFPTRLCMYFPPHSCLVASQS